MSALTIPLIAISNQQPHGIPIFGIDITEWLALASIVVIITTALNKSYKRLQAEADSHNKEMMKQSDDRNEKLLDSFAKTNTHNTDMLKIEFANLSKSIDKLSASYDKFQLREQEHYAEHEKHLVKNDLELQSHGDTLEDHENRIKSNEDDIDYLKDKLSTHKESDK